MSGFANHQPWRGQRVLVLSPTPSHPQDYGNRRRIHIICSKLKAQGASIDFAHYPGEHDWRRVVPKQAEAEMVAAWDSYYLIPPSVPLHTDPVGEHHDLDSWWDPSVGTFLRWLFEHKPYDVFIVNYTWLSRAFEYAPRGVIRILDTHDRFAGRKELLRANGVPPEFFYLADDEEEAKAFARADIVWAIKQEEADHFTGLTAKPVLPMPHVEEGLAVAAPAADPQGYLRVGIIGANNNVNRANIEQFLADALPRITDSFAPVRFVVAGSVCQSLRLPDEPSISVMGRVERIEDFYGSVDAVIVPMEFSTGLKIKTGEALSMGVPVISTAHAFEGFYGGHPLQKLRDFQQMADAVITVAFDRKLLDELRLAAQSAFHATRQQIDKSFAETLRLVQQQSGTSLQVVDGAAFDADSLYGAAVVSMSNYLDQFARNRLFVASGKVWPGWALSAVLDRWGVIYAGAGADLSAVGGLVEKGMIHRTSLIDAADDLAARSIMLDAPHGEADALTHFAGPIFMRPSLMAMILPEDEVLAALGAAPPASWLTGGENARLRKLAADTSSILVRSPALHGQPEIIGRMKRVAGARRLDVVVFTCANSPYGEALRGMLAALGLRVAAVESRSDDGALPILSGEAEGGKALRLSARQFQRGLETGSTGLPAAVVDASGGSLSFAVLAEVVERLDIPVLRPRPMQPGQMIVAEGPFGTPGGLLDTIRQVEACLQDTDAARTDGLRRQAESLGTDGGWSYVRQVGTAAAEGRSVPTLDGFGVF